jgi:hypothetical protein
MCNTNCEKPEELAQALLNIRRSFYCVYIESFSSLYRDQNPKGLMSARDMGVLSTLWQMTCLHKLQRAAYNVFFSTATYMLTTKIGLGCDATSRNEGVLDIIVCMHLRKNNYNGREMGRCESCTATCNTICVMGWRAKYPSW